MNDLYRQAQNVQRVGVGNSREDTELVYVTPREKAILKLLGGSGREDPDTGLEHYDAGRGGGYEKGDTMKDYGDNGWGGSQEDNDSFSNNYAAMASENDKWMGSKPKSKVGAKDVIGAILNPFGAGGVNLGSKLVANTKALNAWSNSMPYGSRLPDKAPTRTSEQMGGNGLTPGGYAMPIAGTLPAGGLNNQTPAAPGTGTSQINSLSTGGGNSLFPSVYTDPVTGRLLSRSQDSSESYQQLMDQILGTHVAQTPGDPNNPLLAYMDSGLGERVANENLDNTVNSTMKAQDDLNARRGLGMSSMQDATRASLGLSSAQGRNQNKLTAQDEAYKKKMNLLNYLQGGQTLSDTKSLSIADMENQRKIAEITAARQDKLADQNRSLLEDQQDDTNKNAWISALGNVDWSSIFGSGA
jgi:hypothetical protein